MAEFGRLGFEKFAPCRGIEKQVFGGDHGAALERNRLDRRQRAADCLDACTTRGRLQTRGNGEARNRAQTRQCLAAEPEARHPLEVIKHANLAGGMARQRQRQLIGGNAATVIADAQAFDATLQQIDIDGAGTRIQTVLQQLLERGGGPFDHFAGGNLVDEKVGEYPYGGELRRQWNLTER